jgi:hypothetical protein
VCYEEIGFSGLKLVGDGTMTLQKMLSMVHINIEAQE